MIVVKVEMYPKGSKTRMYPLAVLTIANDGTGTARVGNYVYALSHSGKNCGKRGIMKNGKVKGLNRARSNAVYRLLARVLKDAGFE